MDSNLQYENKLTPDDITRALAYLKSEMADLERSKTAIQRKIDALRTQGLVISQLARTM